MPGLSDLVSMIELDSHIGPNEGVKVRVEEKGKREGLFKE